MPTTFVVNERVPSPLRFELLVARITRSSRTSRFRRELYDEAELQEEHDRGKRRLDQRRYAARRWLRDKRLPELLELIAKQQPPDVLAQQEKVAARRRLGVHRADLLDELPGHPARLDRARVHLRLRLHHEPETPGYTATSSGRQPLLQHKKALIMTPTFFRESDYRDSGCGAAIERLVDDFGFRYPAWGRISTVYFYAVGAVDDATRQGYLQRVYRLGHEYRGRQPRLACQSRSAYQGARSNRRRLREVCDEAGPVGDGSARPARARTGAPLRTPAPGELVHIDIKKLGRIEGVAQANASATGHADTTSRQSPAAPVDATPPSAGNTSMSVSTTTAASPTQKYSPTRKALPPSASSAEPSPSTNATASPSNGS